MSNIHLHRSNNPCYKMRYTCSIWLGYERVYMYLVKDKDQNHKRLNDKYLSIYIHEKNDYV